MSRQDTPAIAPRLQAGAPRVSPERQVLELSAGHLCAQSIGVFATLGLPDILQASPRALPELATLTGTHAPSLERWMRYLGAIGVVTLGPDALVSLAPLGRALCTRPTSALHDNVRLTTSPAYWTAIGHLAHNLATGECAFRHRTGTEYFAHLAGQPEESSVFNAAMDSSARLGIPALIAAYDFSGMREIVDVAGGKGALLTGILKKYRELRGILFDATPELAQVECDPMVAARMSTRAGSFFDEIPPGADAYILRRILHDWNDDRATAILRRCRAAMRPDSRLLVIELAAPEGSTTSRDWATMDMLMMLVFDGRERTRADFERLFGETGFTLQRSITTHSPYWIIEAVPC